MDNNFKRRPPNAVLSNLQNTVISVTVRWRLDVEADNTNSFNRVVKFMQHPLFVLTRLKYGKTGVMMWTMYITIILDSDSETLIFYHEVFCDIENLGMSGRMATRAELTTIYY